MYNPSDTSHLNSSPDDIQASASGFDEIGSPTATFACEVPIQCPESTEIPSSPRRLDTKGVIDDLRVRCPLPALMKRMGYDSQVKKCCKSPFRSDKTPSWGVFKRDGRWLWKDHGTGEGGDEIEFIKAAKKLRDKDSFREALAIWESLANGDPVSPEEMALPEPEPRCKPDASAFGPGTADQLVRLARLRDISQEGLLLARSQGFLIFGTFIHFEVYGVTDASGQVVEVRRLDGASFPAHGDLPERKSHALKGSLKSWPVGISNVGDRSAILLLEGLPDFLAAFEVVHREGALDRVAPVAMLSAGPLISIDALPAFKGRHVRIIPHADASGTAATKRWTKQLREVGCSVDVVALAGGVGNSTKPVKDLNDYLPVYRTEIATGGEEARLLP